MSARGEFLRGIWLSGLCAVLLLCVSPARAQSKPEPKSAAEPEPPAQEALPWQPGPTQVDLGHELSIELSESYMYLPKEPSAKILERMGSFYHDNLLGLIAGTSENAEWFVVIRYEAEGYIKDDEKIDADELLSGLREGNEEANTERKERGFKPLALEGWAEPPHYDQARHQLVWALVVSDADGKSVNYNTRVLGRHGFASLNLVTDPDKLQAYKSDAAALLGGTAFKTGARYEDFDAATDKTAEYGLAGLIAAGAGLGATKLIKLGLLAKFWKVILAALFAGKKVILVALVAAGVYVKKLLGARRAASQPPQQ
jgi:uncharacterized membrane-anchored protein